MVAFQPLCPAVPVPTALSEFPWIRITGWFTIVSVLLAFPP